MLSIWKHFLSIHTAGQTLTFSSRSVAGAQEWTKSAKLTSRAKTEEFWNVGWSRKSTERWTTRRVLLRHRQPV